MSQEGKVCMDAGKAEGRYANYLKVGHNSFEFMLDFSQFYSESAKAELCARIITSPVEITIHRPTVSLGNILSKDKVKGEFPEIKGMTEDFSPIAQKLEMLLQDKEAAESLKRVE